MRSSPTLLRAVVIGPRLLNVIALDSSSEKLPGQSRSDSFGIADPRAMMLQEIRLAKLSSSTFLEVLTELVEKELSNVGPSLIASHRGGRYPIILRHQTLFDAVLLCMCLREAHLESRGVTSGSETK